MEILEIIASLLAGPSSGDAPTPPWLEIVFLIFALVFVFVFIIASVVGRS